MSSSSSSSSSASSSSVFSSSSSASSSVSSSSSSSNSVGASPCASAAVSSAFLSSASAAAGSVLGTPGCQKNICCHGYLLSRRYKEFSYLGNDWMMGRPFTIREYHLTTGEMYRQLVTFAKKNAHAHEAGKSSDHSVPVTVRPLSIVE